MATEEKPSWEQIGKMSEEIASLKKERDMWEKRTGEADEEYVQRKGRYLNRIAALKKERDKLQAVIDISVIAQEVAYGKWTRIEALKKKADVLERRLQAADYLIAAYGNHENACGVMSAICIDCRRVTAARIEYDAAQKE